MTVIIGADHYQIQFSYETMADGRRVTTCEIVQRLDPDVDEGVTEKAVTPLAAGAAICVLGDNFCKETGRKLALMRAVVGFDKPTRAAFWMAYLDRKKSKGVLVRETCEETGGAA